MNGSHCRQEEFQVRMMAWRMANYVTIVHLQQGQIQLKASHSSWVGYGPRASALVITIEEVGNWCLSLPNICSNPQFWHLQCSASAAGLHWIGPITRLNSEPLKLQTWGFDALWKCSFRTNGQVAYSLNFNIEGGQSGTMSSGKRIATQSSTCKELSNFSMRPLHQSICKSLIVAARCHVPRHVSQPALWFFGVVQQCSTSMMSKSIPDFMPMSYSIPCVSSQSDLWPWKNSGFSWFIHINHILEDLMENSDTSRMSCVNTARMLRNLHGTFTIMNFCHLGVLQFLRIKQKSTLVIPHIPQQFHINWECAPVFRLTHLLVL